MTFFAQLDKINSFFLTPDATLIEHFRLILADMFLFHYFLLFAIANYSGRQVNKSKKIKN